MQLGVVFYKVIDVIKVLYEECFKYLVYGNVLCYQMYLFLVSVEWMFQVLEVVKYVKLIGVDVIVYGSMGVGNDQVCFDFIF